MKDDKIEKEIAGNAGYWNQLLRHEFAKESDRAAVILAASMLDNALETLIKSRLVPIPGANDDLFEGPNAPLSTFDSRVNLGHRIGLISPRFARDLHLVRKIRNSFAHNVHGCNFENASVKSRTQELLNSAVFAKLNREQGTIDFASDTRGDFLMCCSWMLFELTSSADGMSSFKERSLEWGYKENIVEKEKPSKATTKKQKND